jgi:predicted RNase H-like HicB family nuclease
MANLSAVIRKEKSMYVSWCPELDIASQGKSIEEAIANLKEAVELYLEDEDAKLPEATPFLTTFEVTYAKAARATGA